MRFFTLRPIVTSFTAFALVACGGSSKPAEDAATASNDAATAEPAKADGAKDDAAKAEPEKKEEKDTGMPKVVRTPKDKLTAPDIVFKFSFKESDVGIKADEKCSESSKDDGEKKAKCMVAAAKKVTIDDWHFKQDNENWYLLGLRTTGAKVTWTHRMPIDFGKQTDTTVVVKITGPDKGQAAWKNPPSELTFEVPNDYQIIQKDPELGKLVFEAKISTLGDGNTKPAR